MIMKHKILFDSDTPIFSINDLKDILDHIIESVKVEDDKSKKVRNKFHYRLKELQDKEI